MTALDYSPFETRLLTLIRSVQDEIGGLVSSPLIAKKIALPERTVRYYVKRLESVGLLSRPDGPRAGYSALNGAPCSLKVRDSHQQRLNVLRPLDFDLLRLLDEAAAPLSAPALRRLLNVHHRTTILRHLQHLEAMDLIHRPAGPKRGYVIREPHGSAFYTQFQAAQLRGGLAPFLLRILADIRTHERYCEAVSSRYLAQQAATAERSMRYYLHRLSQSGCVERPHGIKGGYRLSAIGAALLELEARHGTAQ